MRTTLVALLATLLAFGVSGRSARAADVIETISSNSNYSTFSGLVAKAGLVQALRSLKACTVFVPDNSAFRRLPASELENLQKPERKDDLVKFIGHHIVASLLRDTSMDGNDFRIGTLGGQQIHIDADDRSGIAIDDAKIGRLNIVAGNCVIHELNRVLYP